MATFVVIFKLIDCIYSDFCNLIRSYSVQKRKNEYSNKEKVANANIIVLFLFLLSKITKLFFLVCLSQMRKTATIYASQRWIRSIPHWMQCVWTKNCIVYHVWQSNLNYYFFFFELKTALVTYQHINKLKQKRIEPMCEFIIRF